MASIGVGIFMFFCCRLNLMPFFVFVFESFTLALGAMVAEMATGEALACFGTTVEGA